MPTPNQPEADNLTHANAALTVAVEEIRAAWATVEIYGEGCPEAESRKDLDIWASNNATAAIARIQAAAKGSQA